MSQEGQGAANQTRAKRSVRRLRARRSTLVLWAFFLITPRGVGTRQADLIGLRTVGPLDRRVQLSGGRVAVRHDLSPSDRIESPADDFPVRRRCLNGALLSTPSAGPDDNEDEYGQPDDNSSGHDE